MTVLHIDSSARLNHSNSRIVGQYLIEAIGEPVTYRDLAQQPLPPISAQDLIGVQGSSDEPRDSLQAQLSLSDTLINELKNANTLVMGVSMYNFGIPATLKQWVDAICRPGVSFRYTQEGPVGLLGISKAYIITASGGTPIGSDMDFASRYLEHICKFMGIAKVFHIDLSGSKGTPEQVIKQGQQQIDSLMTELSAE